ncbi:uncharacterized protein LOC129953375 isoform X2 [Eupeodes corollae]|uniref:uncharacterized protein LOC129953375 isoform X2 n=1 Tax=Eupeodes corollae TaxID=290404 RepID=UPI002491E872|nr:uncharacterized protein LOC129953375 isoform X2 [Eupeodes corollae]
MHNYRGKAFLNKQKQNIIKMARTATNTQPNFEFAKDVLIATHPPEDYERSVWKIVTHIGHRVSLKYGWNVIGNKESNYIEIKEFGVKKSEFVIHCEKYFNPTLIDVGHNLYLDGIKMNGKHLRLDHKNVISLVMNNSFILDFQIINKFFEQEEEEYLNEL